MPSTSSSGSALVSLFEQQLAAVQPLRVVGERQQRATVERPVAVAPVASTIVGARSALTARSSTSTPAGIPGPRITSGTRTASS